MNTIILHTTIDGDSSGRSYLMSVDYTPEARRCKFSVAFDAFEYSSILSRISEICRAVFGQAVLSRISVRNVTMQEVTNKRLLNAGELIPDPEFNPLTGGLLRRDYSPEIIKLDHLVVDFEFRVQSALKRIGAFEAVKTEAERGAFDHVGPIFNLLPPLGGHPALAAGPPLGRRRVLDMPQHTAPTEDDESTLVKELYQGIAKAPKFLVPGAVSVMSEVSEVEASSTASHSVAISAVAPLRNAFSKVVILKRYEEIKRGLEERYLSDLYTLFPHSLMRFDFDDALAFIKNDKVAIQTSILKGVVLEGGDIDNRLIIRSKVFTNIGTYYSSHEGSLYLSNTGTALSIAKNMTALGRARFTAEMIAGSTLNFKIKSERDMILNPPGLISAKAPEAMYGRIPKGTQAIIDGDMIPIDVSTYSRVRDLTIDIIKQAAKINVLIEITMQNRGEAWARRRHALQAWRALRNTGSSRLANSSKSTASAAKKPKLTE